LKKTFHIFLLILFFLFPDSHLNSQDVNISFNYLTHSEGLKGSKIYSILRDSLGYIWFGTNEGLCKYNGYNFKTYNITKEIKTNRIAIVRALIEDNSGKIWAGTNFGIARYNRKFDSFEFFKIDKEKVDSQRLAFTCDFAIDTSKVLWLGLYDKLYKYNKLSEEFEVVDVVGLDSSKTIRKLYFDDKNQLWIGYNEGLFCYRMNSDYTLEEVYPEKMKKHFEGEVIRTIYEDEEKNIWIGTRERGLFCWDRDDENFELFSQYRNKPINFIGTFDTSKVWIGSHFLEIYDYINKKLVPYSALDDRDALRRIITCGYLDKDKILWLGTSKSGVIYLKTESQIFQKYSYRVQGKIQKSIGSVTGFFDSPDNKLWISDGNGIDMYDERKGTIVSLSDVKASSFLKLSNNKLLIASKKGLNEYKIDNPNVKYSKKKIFSDAKKILDVEKIMGMVEAPDGKIWIATFNKGLFIYDPITKEQYNRDNFKDYPEQLFYYNNLSYIYIDGNENIWIYCIGANELLRYSNTGEYKVIPVKENRNLKMVAKLNLLYEDKAGNLFAGTNHGLLMLNKKRDEFNFIYDKPNMLPVAILSIQEDDDNYLWLATSKGLFKLEPNTLEIVQSTDRDSFKKLKFEPNSSVKIQDGRLFFGLSNGFISFQPSEVKPAVRSLPIIFTNLAINGMNVDHATENSPLKRPLSESRRIDLNHKQNSISLEFGAIEFFEKENLKYLYTLKGYDRSWLSSKGPTQVTYSRLEPGEYIFKVKFEDQFLYPSTGTRSIRIDITPPIWKTTWFRILSIISIVALLLTSYYFRIYNLQKRQQLLEQKIDERTKELTSANQLLQQQKNKILNQHDEIVKKNKITLTQRDQLKEMVKRINEVSESRTNFFTNVSHELLTPLTLILGPTERVLRKKDKNISKEQYYSYSLIHRNARRLLKLVKQLLDFQKVDSGDIKLEIKSADIVLFLKEIINSMSYKANLNGIELLVSSNSKSSVIPFDPDKVESILFNLLGNALKFTRKGDKIEVEIEIFPVDLPSNKGYYSIKVSDSGEGIPERKLPDIFKKYYSLDTVKSNHSGFGIGLSYVKDLVDFMNGSIEVQSEFGEGTCFVVRIPYDLNLVTRENLIDITLEEPWITDEKYNKDRLFTTEFGDIEAEKLLNCKVLIVEDNPEVRYFIADILKEYYQILEAGNGIEAMEMLKGQDIDLIVTDLMMPEMDGIELCDKVKKSILTCHIPIIMLTAKSQVQNKLKGFQTGADDYITKPFDEELLLARTRNLILSRTKIREKYKNELLAKPSDVQTTSLDEEFLMKLNNLLETEYSDPNLNVELLGSKMAFSRPQFFRKVKALLGLTPVEYLINFRLSKASSMLSAGKQSIADISEQTGFKNPSNFTTLFRKHFGVTPSEYSKNSIL